MCKGPADIVDSYAGTGSGKGEQGNGLGLFLEMESQFRILFDEGDGFLFIAYNARYFLRGKEQKWTIFHVIWNTN